MESAPLDLAAHVAHHGAALRQLAAELLRDGASADDAVQETWLRALTHPPRHERQFGGWLATVLRNLVARSRRSERRRARWEQAAARELVAADHSEVAARTEVAERLIAAVRDLPEPFGTVVWQRYFEELPPREIAARAGVPLATVKSRLQRGLQQVRERLGEGGECDWRGALVGAFGFEVPEGTGITAAAVTGGVTMAAWSKVAAAAVVAGVAVWLCWPTAPSGSPAPSRGDEATVLAAQVSSTTAHGTALAGGTETERVEREIAARAAGTPEQPTAVVRGRCVGTAGEALADCRVRIEAFDSEDRLEEWLRDNPPPEWRDLEQTTGADGTFAFTFWPPPPLRFSLRVERTGSSPLVGALRPVARTTTDVGDVRIVPGVLVTGSVVDAQGRPVPDIGVVANEKNGRSGFDFSAPDAPPPAVRLRADVPTAQSGADGRFRFGVPLSPGAWAVNLVHGGAWRDGCTVELPAGVAEDLTLLCSLPADAPTIRGRVVDADGVAVGGAAIHIDRAQFTRSGSDGTFSLRRSPDARIGDRVVVHATHDAHLASEPTEPLPWGTDGVELRLRRGCTLVVGVVDPDARPVEQFTVRVASKLCNDADEARVRARGPFANGIATATGLERGTWHVAVEFPRASGLVTHVQPVLLDGDGTRVDVRAEREVTRTLRVVRADGTPVAGTRIELLDRATAPFGIDTHAESLRSHLRRTAVGSPFPIGLLVAEGTTDADGTFVLRGSASRPQALRVLGPGHIAHCDAEVDLGAPGDLVVTVRSGARLVAHVTPLEAIAELRRRAGLEPAGQFADGRSPSLQLFQPAPPGEFERAWPAKRGDGRAPLTDDGRFVLDAIPAGTWRVGVVHWHIMGRSWAGLDRIDAMEVALADGETREVSLDLGFVLPGTLAGLLQHNGAPLAHTDVTIANAATGSRRQSRTVTTDAEGRFRVLLPPDRYSVACMFDMGTPQSRSEAADGEAEVFRDGVTEQTFHLTTGALEVQLRRGDVEPAADVVLWLGDDPPRRARFGPTDADGRAHVDRRPGVYTVFAGRSRDEAIALGTVELRAGATTAVELRLSAER